MKVKEIIKLLEVHGWECVRQKGSHKQFRHQTKPGTVTVSGHRMSDDIPKGTEKSIKKQAGIK